MRTHFVFAAALALTASASLLLPAGCGSTDNSEFPPGDDGGTDDGTGGGGGDDGGGGFVDGAGTGGDTGGTVQQITSMRIVPADATINLTVPGASATQAYQLLAVINGGGPEVD
ncbi:MAG: hypothetical protein JWM74_2273, partial [Myxococcaceae bacterium]|nr:hypothetical protein [Myxococcaceae bacterium]